MGVMWNRQPEEIELGQWLAGMLTECRNRPVNQALLDGVVLRETEAPVNSVIGGDSENVPPFYAAQSGGQTLILIGCTQNILMGLRLLNGYGGITSGFQTKRHNLWAENAGLIVRNAMNSNHFATPNRLIVAGYSAGGMVAQIMFTQYLTVDLATVPHCVTFGAPRASTSPYRVDIGSAPICRWMNSDDGVCLIPPRLSNNPAWAAALSSPVMIAYGQFAHVQGGADLSPTGVITSNDLPTTASLHPTLSLAAFIQDQVTGNVGPHAISEYLARLNLAALALRDVPQPELPDAPPEPPADTTRREVDQAQVRAVNRIFQQGADQQRVPVRIPDAMLARVVRQGRIYSVYWGTTFIAMGPTKRRAFNLKRYFNVFLKTLQHQAVTEPDAMVHQFQVYFDLATQEGNGFAPVMQDEFPED